MVDAEEREWTRAQMAILLTAYLFENGSVTFAEARRVTGGGYWKVKRLLVALDATPLAYKEGKRRVLLKRTED